MALGHPWLTFTISERLRRRSRLGSGAGSVCSVRSSGGLFPKAPGGRWEADGRLGSRVKARPITALPVTLKGLRASFEKSLMRSVVM